ncbi:MAG TPA: helix-turn-helix transcriptional regulator [Thermoanaerobaculia bacterium]|nr:helix-turn-helix transcriptional regulator [Thermoanaerobaculia bacterium]
MTAARQSPERELRRGVLEMVLLRVLMEGQAYGYNLVSEIAERSEGELEVKEGTLYPLLYRLEEQGLVRAEWDTPERGAPRKYYRITPEGKRAFAERAEQWRRFARRVDALIAPNEGGGRS